MDKPLSLEEIEQLLKMLDDHEVTEFKLERAGEKLVLRRKGAASAWGHQIIPQIQQVFSAGGSGIQAAPGAAAFASASSAKEQESAASASVFESSKTSSAPPMPLVQAGPIKNTVEISSPMVGTFYRRPAVDAEPYVDVGDYVKKGDVLCIVEAMKLMNEIESDVSGKVIEICLDDGQMVEYGEKLFRIEVG